MGAPKKHIETVQTSVRVEKNLSDFLKNIGQDKFSEGLHLIGHAAMTWKNQPELTTQEANFICDTLNGYMAGREDPRLIKHELEDALSFGQGSMFEIESNFVDEVKSWTAEECEALKNAAAAFWGMVLIDNQQSANQFFKINQ